MASDRYLIDTHCWLWWHIEPDRLGPESIRLIENGETELYFSVVSAWEITIKLALSKLELPVPPVNYIPSRLQQSPMKILPVHLEHTINVGRLATHHKDPFDRLLIAQAKSENLTVITHDSQFARYDLEIVY